jgi:hypothetical protein
MSASATDSREIGYDAALASWVRHALTRGAESFPEFVELLPGVEPGLALRALQSVPPTDLLSPTAQRLVRSALAPSPTLAARPEVPLPHPLEFDWRFTSSTASLLRDEVASIVDRGGTVVYLGAPTVFDLARRTLPGRRHVLVDFSHRRFGASVAGDVHVADLMTGEAPNVIADLVIADLVIADPPWYPEETSAFVRIAAEILRVNGYLILSHAPAGTRPSAIDDAADARATIQAGGMEIVSERTLLLRYQTPPFESVAARAARMPSPPADWRRGDMIVAKRSRDARIPKHDQPGTTCESWTVIEIDDVPIAYRRWPPVVGLATGSLLEPIVSGDVLPSVSRRDPRRAAAILWTSMNRVYRSPVPEAIAEVVLLAQSRSVETERCSEIAHRWGVEKDKVVATAKFVTELVQRERKEHGLDV